MNRVGQQGYPIDTIFTTRMKSFLQHLMTSSMASDYAEKQLNMRFDHANYGLKPNHRCQQTHPPTMSISGAEHPQSGMLQRHLSALMAPSVLQDPRSAPNCQ